MRERLVFCDYDTLETNYLREFISQGRVPQILFYLLNGATAFYSYRNGDLAQIAWEDEYRFFKEQDFWRRDRRIGFVSLGCGNAGPEKMLLRKMQADGYELHYVGVDSSERMLELAAENLSEDTYRQSFVLADFSDPAFPGQLHEVVQEDQARVYAMIGGTFGNFDQRHVADLLAGLVPPGDYLYLDVVPTQSTEHQNAQLRMRLSHLPDNLSGFFDRLLGALGLSREFGEILREERSDGALETIRFTFSFRATEHIQLSCLDAEMALEPGQMVELFTIRAYDPASLAAFMAESEFELIDTYAPDVGNLSHRWQRLLFSKAG